MSDENFVSDVLDNLKKQGLFDRFRKECLADVDTKPAYQNLQLRFKEAVGKYLHELKWNADLNKNQSRENLRRYLNDSLPMLTNGIDRVIEQVVKPKVLKSLKPQIDPVICEHLSIDYEQWLSEQNDAHKKKQAKAEDGIVPVPALQSQCTAPVVPSFPHVVTVTVPLAHAVSAVTPPVSTAAPPPVVEDLCLPPPPPPPSFEEPNDSTSSPPDPPPPPPLPSDASEDESSIPAPPPDPDVNRTVNSPPPLPPDDDDGAVLPAARDEAPVEEEVFEGTRRGAEDRPEDSEAVRMSAAVRCAVAGKTDSVGRPSDDGSPNDGFSYDDSFPAAEASDGASKEYRFAWNDFNESDVSDVSVSSVHTSDLSNFEEEEGEEDGGGGDLGEAEQSNGNRNRSKDGDISKDSDSKQGTSFRHSLNESMHESLDTSNASFNSSGKRRTKKEELKERKMEEKKEMKRRRVLNRRYCSEEFMSIFNDKKILMEKQETREEIKTKDEIHSESKVDEDAKPDGDDNASDLDNAYSPYSNISEASSDSVVLVGVEPAKPKKGKKSKSRKRSRSSDGNRRKKRRRRHKSSRRSSRHCSGVDEELEDVSSHFLQKQDGTRAKVHEVDSSSKGYLDEDLLMDGYYVDDSCNDLSGKKKTKRSVDRINFGEAERQAAAFRMTAGGKQTPFSVASPAWQKQSFISSPQRSSRQQVHGFVGQPNFSSMPATTAHKHIRQTPFYHQQQINAHPVHETSLYERKNIGDSESYRHSRNASKKTFRIESEGDDVNVDSIAFKRLKRNDDGKAKHVPTKCAKLTTEEFQKDARHQKRHGDYFDMRNKR